MNMYQNISPIWINTNTEPNYQHSNPERDNPTTLQQQALKCAPYALSMSILALH